MCTSQRLRVRFVPDSNIASTLFLWSRAVLALTKHLGTVHQLISADQSLLGVAQRLGICLLALVAVGMCLHLHLELVGLLWFEVVLDS